MEQHGKLRHKMTRFAKYEWKKLNCRMNRRTL
jgi:hypothetical protein